MKKHSNQDSKRSGPRRGRRNPNVFNPRGFNASQTLKVRSIIIQTFTSNGGGVCAGVMSLDPVANSIVEFTNDWANLYTQYRLAGSRLRLVSAITEAIIETKTANYKPLAIGYQNRSTASLATPTGYAQVLDNQPARVWNVSSDTSSGGLLMTQRAPPRISFLETNASTSPGYAGAPGGWQFYGDTFTTSIPVFTAFLEIFYILRSRS